jgi:hypothetical protein
MVLTGGGLAPRRRQANAKAKTRALRMTLQEAKSIARHLGLTLRQVRSGAYRVNFRDGNETPITRTISKTPSTPQSRWPVSENCQPGRSPTVAVDNHHAENSDHRDCVVAEAHHRPVIPAAAAAETARPVVPGELDGEREQLRTRLRQIPGRYPQERLVSRRLARERQLLHSLTRSAEGAPWQHLHKVIAKLTMPYAERVGRFTCTRRRGGEPEE